MSERGPLPPKLYFRIGEVAGLVGVEPHVLRYWEREFRSIRPTKSAKGQRVYSRRDVENLIRVRELLYGQGFTIAGARRRLREKVEGGADSGPDLAADDKPTAAPGHEETPAETRVAEPVAAAPAGPLPQLSSHAREELLALKSEVESLLAELGGAP